MNLIEQAIENCHMTHKYENPGIENGMCAGLRTMNGEGEPPEECKECRLYYGYAEEHNIKQTNADLIRSMSDEDLAMSMMCPNENGLGEIDCDKSDNCNCYECILKWMQSEVEE